ncbi:hypothetical protein [Burkholderia gladioli]|uniref:hypothetical protein n=1 Tax=Burkholderia gladioli TaxID=28095 RepID=UPI0030D1BB67
MSNKNVIPLACRAPSVFYTVSIEHGPDGVRSIKIHDVEESDENQRRVAAALREAADMLSPTPAPAVFEGGWQPIETAPKETELLGWRKDCGVLLIMYTSADRWATDAECEEMDEEVLFQKDWFGTALPGFLDRLEVEQVPTHWMPLPADPIVDARDGDES